MRRGIPGKRLNDLLSGPLRRGMFRDIEMHKATALMREHDEDKEHAAGGGRDEKKVAGYDVLDMRVEKGLPGR